MIGPRHVQMNLFRLQEHHIGNIHLTFAGTYVKQKKLQPFLPTSKRKYVIFIVLWSETLKTVQLPHVIVHIPISTIEYSHKIRKMHFSFCSSLHFS